MQPDAGARVLSGPPPPPVRPLALALCAAVLTGCADTDPAPPPGSPEALRLLEAVDASAVADAFAALDALAYRADLVVTTLDADRQPVARETATRTHDAGDARDAATPALHDVVASALSDDPPYVDPVARGAYRLAVVGDTTIGDVAFRLVEAVLTDPEAELSVARVWAAVADGGRVGAVEVERRATSAIYTEASRVRVDLAPHAGGWIPRHIVTDTWTDVPLSAPTHVLTEWTVRPAATASGA